MLLPERFLLLNLKFNGQYSREEIIFAPKMKHINCQWPIPSICCRF